jgi:hypothetical protein|tara:strand:+ start:1041 stop:1334 length:294 start_codon:yes stop_codon:yes gene_type:complete
MRKSRWSSYDKYLVLADSSTALQGTYASYMNFKRVLEVLNNLVAKRTTQYLYNGDMINFGMKQSEMESILACYDEVEYHPRFDNIRLISNKLNLKII